METTSLPLCTAPHTAVLLDVDKTVRPCCAYEGEHLPGTFGIARLGERTLAQVLSDPAWSRVREDLDAGRVPSGCRNCLDREHRVGSSQRLAMAQRQAAAWRDGLTYFELSSSNLCNLQCRHCAPLFSSRWSAFRTRQGWREVAPIVRPDAELLRRSLNSVDLSHLRFVSLKGGEPMLNADVHVFLEHLDAIGVLPRVTLNMVTNGTVVDEAILSLLRRAGETTICLSIDGFGPVQTYIRHGGSDLAKVEANLHRYAAEPRFRITRNTSVMAYNVFSLDRIDAWWDELAATYPGRLHHRYSLFVLWPAHLSVSCLQDATRRRLTDRYAALDAGRYAPVLRALALPYAGDDLHDEFVEQTEIADRELGRSWRDAVPELADEMHLLSPARIAAKARRRTLDELVATAAGGPSEHHRADPPPQWLELPGTLQAIWRHLDAGELSTAQAIADGCRSWLSATLPTDLRGALLHAQGAVAGLSGAFRVAEALLAEAAAVLPGNAVVAEHLQRARELAARS